MSRGSLIQGAVPKWPKVEVCKTSFRGFESHPRLQDFRFVLCSLTASALPSNSCKPLVAKAPVDAQDRGRAALLLSHTSLRADLDPDHFARNNNFDAAIF